MEDFIRTVWLSLMVVGIASFLAPLLARRPSAALQAVGAVGGVALVTFGLWGASLAFYD